MPAGVRAGSFAQLLGLRRGYGLGHFVDCGRKAEGRQVRAFDTDAIAVQTTRENAAKNGIETITVHQGTLSDVPNSTWDVVVVNILAHVIIPLLEEAQLMRYVAPQGKLILSGIIEEQLDSVETAVHQAGGQIIENIQVRDWVCLIVSHRK